MQCVVCKPYHHGKKRNKCFGSSVILAAEFVSLTVYGQHKSSEEPLKDKVFTGHNHSVIRHEVKQAPNMNGMLTIKVLVFCVEYV